MTISATFGILATSAINNAWGLELWCVTNLRSNLKKSDLHPGISGTYSMRSWIATGLQAHVLRLLYALSPGHSTSSGSTFPQTLFHSDLIVRCCFLNSSRFREANGSPPLFAGLLYLGRLRHQLPFLCHSSQGMVFSWQALLL